MATVRRLMTEKMNIYVGNLAYQLTDDDLKAAFQAYGEVESARIIMDHDGRSKGFGFVEMTNREEALAAIEALNGTEMAGRAITANEARPKPEGGNRRDFGDRPRGRSGPGDKRRGGGGFGGRRGRY